MTQLYTEPGPGHGRHVAVIGGGITGLAAAHRLVSVCPDVKVTLIESTRRLGGIIRTEEADEFLMELGPDSFITNKPAALQLCREVGFLNQLISTDARFRRSLVLRKGKPLPVPEGFMLMAPAKPWTILTTPVLSVPGRLRLLAEAFLRRKPDVSDESLASFVRRRFGQETFERLVQPLVGGIYTADPEKLSLRATMPRFLDMEAQHGSVIRATLLQQGGSENDKSTSGSGARYGMFVTAARGLSDLIHAIEKTLLESGRVTFHTGTSVVRIARHDSRPSRWQIVTRTVPDEALLCTAEYDAVIATLPTHRVAGILPDESFRTLTTALNEIPYASSAIVVSGHRLKDFEHPMDAFGMVVPAIENRRILAVSFSSRKFLHRAPDQHILLRTFVGGAMQPHLLAQDDDAIVSMVHEELRQIFGMSKEPLFSEVMRYNHAMPQYHVGHLDLVSRIDAEAARFPGLHLAGNAYHGVGIPDSIASGREAADRCLSVPVG